MASGSMYSYYLPKYNTAIAVQSPVDISISLIRNTATTYTATVTVTKAQTTVPALTLKTALTQSNISYNWQNQTKLYWVERTMYPSFTGTTVTFTGNTFTYTANIDLGTWGGNVANGDWEFVAFVQQSDKTISQGEMVNLKDAGYVGIDEVANKNVDLKFYPNPVEEKGVVVTNFDSKNEVIMKINNILGEEVFNKNIGKTVYGNMYDINTANLPAGMYILNMFVDDQIVTKKIQVQ
ncbi:MAG TPA: T9SS type A sorting domain-containing protein [Bacteroidales bacterium]|nr:T9SS type A sorting domain-containing protein [Bacteroidales bacterium]